MTQPETFPQGNDDPFRLLVESVMDYAIFLLDSVGNILSWNKGGEQIKGYQTAEVLGRHFSIFYPPEEIEQGKPEYALRVAAEEGRWEEEGWRIRKDGSRFWANAVITAVHNVEGQLVGFAKVTQDLTERRRAEEQRTRHRLVTPVVSQGELEIDVLNRQVHIGSETVRLTALEQSVLFLLVANAGRMVTRSEIVAVVWGADFSLNSNFVDRHIRNLRAKLRCDWRHPRYITTERGGYRFGPSAA